MNVLFFILTFVVYFDLQAETSKLCEGWFEKLKIVTSSGCENYCSLASVDMATSSCKSECEDLCKKSFKKSTSSTLTPLLNNAEIDLSKKFPLKAAKAYLLSFEAEKTCLDLFLISKKNDESDACRHFMWAYQMASQLDKKFAAEALSAHETEELQPKEDKEMDSFNNSATLDFFEKNKSLTDSQLKDAFQDLIKNKKLKVIKYDKNNWRH